MMEYLQKLRDARKGRSGRRPPRQQAATDRNRYAAAAMSRVYFSVGWTRTGSAQSRLGMSHSPLGILIFFFLVSGTDKLTTRRCLHDARKPGEIESRQHYSISCGALAHWVEVIIALTLANRPLTVQITFTGAASLTLQDVTFRQSGTETRTGQTGPLHSLGHDS